MRFCLHRWERLRAQHMRDVSFGEPGVLRTDVYLRCAKCGKPKIERLKGWWSLHELAPSKGTRA